MSTHIPEKVFVPPLPDLLPSEEVSAPFDLPIPDTAVPGKARLIEPPMPDPIFTTDSPD